MTGRRSGRRGSILLIVAVSVLVVAGGFLVYRGVQPTPLASAPVPESTFSISPGEVADPVTGVERRQEPSGPPPDNTLVIPAIDVQTVLDPLGTAPDGSLLLPRDVEQVTYWTGSAPIDAPGGGTLVAGHVDNANQGEGALYRLHTLQPGDAVYLTKDGTVTRWKVVRMERFVKQALPDWAFQGPGGPRELHLVTCGGEIVTDAQGRGTYLENVVVTAVPF